MKYFIHDKMDELHFDLEFKTEDDAAYSIEIESDYTLVTASKLAIQDQ